NIPVVVGDPTAVDWIVHPVVAVGYIHAVEAVAIDKVVVNHNVVAAPSATPAPASPAAAPNRAHSDAHAERDRAGRDDGASGWRIVNGRIGIIIRWRTPYGFGIVYGYVDHLRARGLDLD